MYCPSCGKAYRPGVVACADCREILVEEKPEDPRPEYREFVTVLETGDAARLAVARSMLEAAGIPCLLKSDRVQDLFGFGRIGAGFNVLTGAPKLQVPSDREEEARALLVGGDVQFEDFDDPASESDD